MSATPDSAAPHLPGFAQDTLVFPWARRTPHRALEVLPAIALPLILGQHFGHPAAGSIAAGAAYTVGFAIFHEALASALLSMALVTLGIASATLLGSLAAPWTLAVFAVTAAAAFNYGLFSGLGPTAGWIAQQCATFAIVNAFFASGPSYAFGRAGMVLLGGAMQMLFFTLFRWLQTHGKPGVPVVCQVRTRTAQLARGWRGELHWNASTTAYTLRLVVTLLAATALYRQHAFKNGYWAPMTALLVLKPQWSSTLSRGLARTLGTTLGAAFTVLLLALHHGAFSHVAYFVLIVLFAWLSVTLQAVNYAAFSAALTLYIVFLFAFGGFSQRSAAEIRLGMTALGGGIALAVDLAWLAFVRFNPLHPASTPGPQAAGLTVK